MVNHFKTIPIPRRKNLQPSPKTPTQDSPKLSQFSYQNSQTPFKKPATKLKIAEETLARETERMEKERIEMERIMGAAQEQINMLKVELAQLEERMMIKVSELTSALQTATAENVRLEAERSRLEIELAATLKQWKEDVEKVKREAAEEIERRGREDHIVISEILMKNQSNLYSPHKQISPHFLQKLHFSQ